jgi:hypothetical protein
MEAWLKFRAPGINLPLGLGIGRIVFNALNKVEWVFAMSILLTIFLSHNKYLTFQNLFFLIPFIILIIQTSYTLPRLDARAEMHIKGIDVAPSTLHFQYVGMEFVKVFSLIIYGLSFFKSDRSAF